MSDSQNDRIRYGNFRNPLGLVWRMLRSGNRAAYSALFREALGIVLKPVDFLLSFRERTAQGKVVENADYPIVLIVGPPRSGTTFVSQVLAHCLKVSYPTNLMALFPNAPVTAGRYFGKLFGQGPPKVFRSFFGQTSRLSGIHDGFFIWNRWLGEDRYEAKQVLSDVERENMRGFFANWAKANPQPFLNKNNRNTDCIAQLSDTLPNAVIVVVRREKHAIVRSLINARERVQGEKRARWGLRSIETESSDPLQYVADVCDQVIEIERRLDVQLEQIAPSRVITTTYECFCENPEALIELLIDRVPSLQRDPNAQLPESFRCSTGKQLSEREETRISEVLTRHSCNSPQPDC